MFKAKLQTIYSKLFKTAYYPTNKYTHKHLTINTLSLSVFSSF